MKILLVFALYIEAQNFIKNINAEKIETFKNLQIFESEKYLILITWTWKISCSFWLTYIFLKYQIFSAINIWIAWSKNLSIWDIFMIDEILDNDSNKKYFPDIIWNPKFLRWSLRTVSKLEAIWEEIIDMEWSSFFEISNKFLDVDKIILIKIISDNLTQKKLDENFIEKLIEKSSKNILEFIEKIKIKKDIHEIEKYNIEKFAWENYFSLTQARKLSDLIWSLHIQTWKSISNLLKWIMVKNKKEASLKLQELEKQLWQYFM